MSDAEIITGKVRSPDGLKGSVTNEASVVGSVQSVASIKATKIAVGEFYDKIDFFDGDYDVTPKAYEQTILETKGLCMKDNVVILEVPYFETSNLQNGYTVYIGSEV